MTGKLSIPASWDAETDVVVVGAGAAGLRRGGDRTRGGGAEVTVLEADAEVGGMMLHLLWRVLGAEQRLQ